MKINKEQLQKLVKEAVEAALEEEVTQQEVMATEDYAPGKYSAPYEIAGKYANVLAKKLGVAGNMKVRKAIVDVMTIAVNDAWESGQE